MRSAEPQEGKHPERCGPIDITDQDAGKLISPQEKPLSDSALADGQWRKSESGKPVKTGWWRGGRNP
jgi:hypothetical protein